MKQQPNEFEPFLTKEYKELVKTIKDRVLSTQLKAAIAVNNELITLSGK